jgi:hypothetical protein
MPGTLEPVFALMTPPIFTVVGAGDGGCKLVDA